ncbi:MAG: primase-helicase family protein [Rikenellaceae bacterium]
MGNEKRATTNAMTPQPKGKGTEFNPTMQPTAPILAEKVRLLDTSKDTEGRGGTYSIAHLISADFCSSDDVRNRSKTARADKAKKRSVMYMFTPAHKGTRETGAKIDPTGLLPLDFDRLKDPDNFEAKAMASGAVFCKPSVSKGYHIAYMYNPEELEYNRALQMAVKWAKLHTGEAADPDALKEIQGFFIADKPAVIYEQGAVIDLAMAEWLEAISGGQETPTPPRTRTTEPPRPKRGRPRNSEAKMKGFLVECEFYHGLTPEDGSWNSCLRKWCEKVAGAGIDQDEAMEWARDPFAPRASCEREFTSMFTRAYKEVEDKEANKATEIAEQMQSEGYEFARIGGVYFRIAGGKLQRWQQREVQRTLGKEWEAKTLKLDGGFIHSPNNIEYHQHVGDCWNLQKPTPQYEVQTDHCNTIIKVIQHIAKLSSSPDILLDYLQIAYCNPSQKLPVVVLTSKAQGTGKSTFFQIVELMFGGNTFIGSVDDISGNFTAGWAHSQMICLEESSTDRRAQNDRIKYLTTTTQIKYEPKGVDPTPPPFFGKILIANNNEDSPIYLQDTDQRYMVLRVAKVEEYDPNLMRSIKAEMGYFLRWLTTERELTTTNESRLWFAQSIIETAATAAAKEAARPVAEVVIEAMRVCIKTDFPDSDNMAVRPTSVKAFTLHLGMDYNLRNTCAALRRAGVRKGVKRAEVFEFHMGGENWVKETLAGTNYVYEIRL